MFQVYFLQKTGPLTTDITALMNDKAIVDFRLKGRLLELRRIPGRDEEVLAQVWGVRPLFASRPFAHKRGTMGLWLSGMARIIRAHRP